MSFISATPYELISHFPQESLFCLGLLTLLMVSTSPSFTRDGASLFLGILSLGCLSLSALFTPCYQNLIISSTATCLCKSIICLAFVLVLIIDFFSSRSSKGTLVLLGFSLLSMLLLLSSNDWFFLFLSVEFLTLCSYCLIAVPGTSRSLEAVLKYFAAGAISTCLLLFGMFMLFVSCESTAFSVFPSQEVAALVFTAFCSSAFLIKAGSAPFHYWVVDAYEGAPTIVMVFLAIVVKLCIFFTLARLLYGPLLEGASFWGPALQLCSGFSIVLGCFGALFQKRVKRLLAYSSINNVGYALAGLSIGNVGGLQSSLVYMLFYSATLLLLFSLLLGKPDDRPVTYVTDLNRLRSSPLAAVLATLCLFSLAGIPPLSGFWIKFFVLSELFNAKLYALAAIGAFGSIFSSFYYVSLIKVLYFEGQKPATESMHVGVPTLFLGFLSIGLVAYPLFPGFIYDLSGSFAIGFFTEFF